MSGLSLSNNIFQGHNNRHGLMVYGHEWGWSKTGEAACVTDEYKLPENKADHTFANKPLYYGKQAKEWRCNNTIKSWFETWRHPLDESELGGAPEKSLV